MSLEFAWIASTESLWIAHGRRLVVQWDSPAKIVVHDVLREETNQQLRIVGIVCKRNFN